MFFNGFTMLLCILSALIGAITALRVAKVTRDYDRVHRTDTPIGDRVAYELGIRHVISKIDSSDPYHRHHCSTTATSIDPWCAVCS